MLCIQLGRLKDAGKAHHSQISLAKMNNVHEALKIARTARNILGANGVALPKPLVEMLVYCGRSESSSMPGSSTRN